MSEIVQLFKDKDKTIKIYPKTLASEVYITSNNSILNELNNKINFEVESENNIEIPSIGEKLDLIINNKIPELNSSLDTKVNKNESNQISEEMLTQSLKESLTKNKVAVVSINSVGIGQFTSEIQNDIGEYKSISISMPLGTMWRVSETKAMVSTGNAYYRGGTLPVISGEKYKLSNIQTVEKIPYVIFVDNLTDLNVIETALTPSITDATTHNNIEVCVPSGATSMLVSSYSKSAAIVKMEYLSIATKKDLENTKAELEGELIDLIKNYENITDELGIDNLFSYHASFNGAEKVANGVKVNSSNQGLRTNEVISNSTKVTFSCKGTFTVEQINITLAIVKKSGATNYITQKVVTGGNYDYQFQIDASNLNVYQDAKSFYLIINSTGTNNTGNILFDEIKIKSYEGIRENNLYNEDFTIMLENIFNEINSNKNKISSLETNSNASILTDANGNKYSISVGTNGQLVSVPHIPTNVLFMGNSLLLGIDTDGAHGGAFGLACTSPQKDYCYHVQQSILNKNTNAQFKKLHVGAFEMAEDDITSQNYITTNSSVWTDKDLVIVQIGDNVNSDIRRTTFNNNFEKLISNIRTKSPNARVICVTGWYYNEQVSNTVKNACQKLSCEYLNISSLYTNVNKAVNHVGEVVTYYDGNTTNIQQSWGTHPYDTGMLEIANMIIDVLDM